MVRVEQENAVRDYMLTAVSAVTVTHTVNNHLHHPPDGVNEVAVGFSRITLMIAANSRQVLLPPSSSLN